MKTNYKEKIYVTHITDKELVSRGIQNIPMN